MTTVIDQARPWFTPSSALAATTQPQFGATAISSGTGSASTQPRMSSRRRPSRWAKAPAPRLVNAFARPNATMNESTAALDPSPKSCSPISGRVERSRPTIAPTNALIATNSENCARFWRRPSWTVRESLEDRLTGLFLGLLLDVDEQRGPDDVRGDPARDDAFRKRVHGQAPVEDDAGTSAPLDSGRPARLAARISACCGGVGGMCFTSA